MKFLCFFSFLTLLFVTNVHAMDKNEENDQFKKIGRNLVAYIGQYLEGKDFVNFSRSSKNINRILKKYMSIKENKEEIVNIINETHLENFSTLVENWKNKKMNNVRMFIDILQQYEMIEYPNQKQASLNQINFKMESKKFENYLNALPAEAGRLKSRLEVAPTLKRYSKDSLSCARLNADRCNY